jgi:riboflavin kinase / FMN adenylyltransferase
VQTFYLNDGQDASLPKSEPCVMAMGFFDGVHIAHQQVIQEAKNIAKKRKVKLAVMTFFPHPREVLCGGKEKMNYLTPLEVKINKFAQLGVDKLYVIKFDQAFAGLSPKGYIEKYVTGLGAKHVVAGFDFTYGHMGKGTMQTMSMDGDGKFLVTVISKLDYKGQKIGSTFIRNLLSNGEVSKIASYLGALYETRGEVIVHHQNLMRKSSYMEVATYPYYTLPSNGLYEVEMYTGDHVYQGSALVYSNKIKLTFNGYLENLKNRTIKLKWIRGLEIENVQLKQI